jgi:hypothetical protein
MRFEAGYTIILILPILEFNPQPTQLDFGQKIVELSNGQKKTSFGRKVRTIFGCADFRWNSAEIGGIWITVYKARLQVPLKIFIFTALAKSLNLHLTIGLAQNTEEIFTTKDKNLKFGAPNLGDLRFKYCAYWIKDVIEDFQAYLHSKYFCAPKIFRV